MQNINVTKGSERYNFIVSILGMEHMTVFKEGKPIALWYISDSDKKTIEEMEIESHQIQTIATE